MVNTHQNRTDMEITYSIISPALSTHFLYKNILENMNKDQNSKDMSPTVHGWCLEKSVH